MNIKRIESRMMIFNKFLQMRPKQVYRNNKIRLYETLIRPVLCHGSVTWTVTHMTQHVLYAFERKILRIYGTVQEKGH